MLPNELKTSDILWKYVFIIMNFHFIMFVWNLYILHIMHPIIARSLKVLVQGIISKDIKKHMDSTKADIFERIRSGQLNARLKPVRYFQEIDLCWFKYSGTPLESPGMSH